MSNLPDSKELHDRAAEAAKETRSTIIKLTTGSIGVLFYIVTREIKPPLECFEQLLVLTTIVFMVAALGSAIWFGFCDAQWSYWWGVELDNERARSEQQNAVKLKIRWHKKKSFSEKSMLVFFFLAAISGGLFVFFRTLP